MQLDAQAIQVGLEASRWFQTNFNCAESVLLAVVQALGLPLHAVPAVASGFGGGVARHQLLCGAVSGGVMAIGMQRGRSKPDQPRDPVYRCVDRFLADFTAAFASTHCRELTRTDFANPEITQAERDRIHREVCTPMVARAAGVAFSLLVAGEGR